MPGESKLRRPRVLPAALLAVAALAALLAAAPAAAQAVLTFKAATDEIDDSGIGFVHSGFEHSTPSFIETTAGGACWADYDADGDVDLFVTNGVKAGESHTSKLYRNKGGGAFEDATSAARVAAVGQGQSCAWGDYDNDGFPDVFVAMAITGASGGRSVLYHNNGDGTFTNVARAAGVDGQALTDPCTPAITVAGETLDRCYATGVAWLDFDNDGDLDLYVGHYANVGIRNCVDWPAPDPGHCMGQENRLYRNDADGTFTDVAGGLGVQFNEDVTKGRSLGVVAGDFDRNGWTDVYVANDMDANGLYVNGGGTFTSEARSRGATNEDSLGRPRAGMGVAMEDFDNDGRPDLLSTHLTGQLDAVYRQKADGTFSDDADALGVTSVGVSRWGGGFVDLNNDGWKDLLVVTGDQSSGLAGPIYLYFWNEAQAKFVEATNTNTVTYAGIGVGGQDNLQNMRAPVFADYDNDGDVDAYVTTLQDDAGASGTPKLARFNYLGVGSDSPNNAWKDNHWIGVDLEGRSTNRDGIGAVVKVIAGGQSQWALAASGGFNSGPDPRLHVGLGPVTSGTIEVTWPALGGLTHVQTVEFDVATEPKKGKFIAIREDRDLRPPAIRVRSAEQLGSAALRVSWTPSHAPDFAAYAVSVGRSPDFDVATAASKTFTSRSATSVDWTGLEPNTDYWFAATVTDAIGQKSAVSPAVTGRIHVKAPPVVVIAPVPVSECSAGGATVKLDASGSFDPNQQPLTFAWTAPGIAFDDATNATPSAIFPLGSTRVTVLVSDGEETSLGEATVVVEDTVPPAIAIVDPQPDRIYAADTYLIHSVPNPPVPGIVVVGPTVVEADATDACGVARVRFASPEGSAVLTEPLWRFGIDPSVGTIGDYRVDAVVTDRVGRTDSDGVTVFAVGTRVEEPEAPTPGGLALIVPVLPLAILAGRRRE